MNHHKITTKSTEETIHIGEAIGNKLRGGEVIELSSDLGGGKTTFTRGLAAGFGSTDPVASPSFTINYVYGRPDGKELWHFDFYRLSDPGIVASELAEAQNDSNNVIVVEWGEVVHDVLPKERILINVKTLDEDTREVTFSLPKQFEYLLQDVLV